MQRTSVYCKLVASAWQHIEWNGRDMIMEDRHDRTRSLLPDGAMERLETASVLIAGLGGVGSWAVEALARAGVGHLILIDFDVVTPSNLNRQLYALESTIGQPKCHVAAARVKDINPNIAVTSLRECFEPGNAALLLDRCGHIDYIVDAIDLMQAKIDLITTAVERGIPIISSMATGNRLDPSRLRVADLQETCNDPFARCLRQRLRKRSIERLKVVFSDEFPVTPRGTPSGVVASTPVVPPIAGFLIAWEVIRDLVF